MPVFAQIWLNLSDQFHSDMRIWLITFSSVVSIKQLSIKWIYWIWFQFYMKYVVFFFFFFCFFLFYTLWSEHGWDVIRLNFIGYKSIASNFSTYIFNVFLFISISLWMFFTKNAHTCHQRYAIWIWKTYTRKKINKNTFTFYIRLSLLHQH